MRRRQEVRAGQRFGNLVVSGPEFKADRWLAPVVCDCGTKKDVQAGYLVSGHTTSCGCRGRGVKPGDRFGRLTVEKVHRGRVTARCDCGTTRSLQACVLRSGNTRSCGCFRRDLSAARATKHGHASSFDRTRLATPEYKCWLSMIGRCTRPRAKDYKWYGGRGIRVCDRWRNSFEAFLDDMGPRPSLKHSIDRIDGDGNYEPGNCRWATWKQQSQNKRDALFLEMNGERLHVTEWSSRLGIPVTTIRGRMRKGLAPSEVLFAGHFKSGPKQQHLNLDHEATP